MSDIIARLQSPEFYESKETMLAASDYLEGAIEVLRPFANAWNADGEFTWGGGLVNGDFRKAHVMFIELGGKL